MESDSSPVIMQVITKSDYRESGIRFVNNEYDYIQTSDFTN